jgi:hypothetical protein
VESPEPIEEKVEVEAKVWQAAENCVGTLEFHWSVSLEKQERTMQDAQKGRPARPQRAKRRGVRFGTWSL